MSLYLVIGSWKYREHAPGEKFEASLDADVEARAVRAGAIRVLERREIKLDLSRATPPKSWA